MSDTNLNRVSTPPALHDYQGVIHLHSTYSDGTGTVAEIAAAGVRSGCDYVLLTDHDSLEARQRGEEGWYEGTLLLAGCEVSPHHRNHYLAFGIDDPIDHSGLAPVEIVQAVSEAGGFGYLSHPFSQGNTMAGRRLGRPMPWDDLEADGYVGVELWSFVTDTGENLRSWRQGLRFLATPHRVIDHPPERNLAIWDQLTATRRVAALGGLDAHQVGLRVRDRVPLRLMAYERSFTYLRTHLLTKRPLTGKLEPDRAELFDALRAGRAYLAMDRLAPARGFRFWAERPDTRRKEGRRVLNMGEEARYGRAEQPWELRVRLPRPAHVRLLRDGRVVAEGRGLGLHHRAEGPGVYRVEATLPAHGRERTWIVSNPVYLR